MRRASHSPRNVVNSPQSPARWLLLGGLVLLMAIGAVLRWTFQSEQMRGMLALDWGNIPPWTFDWDVFRAAALALLHGQNPYEVGAGGMRFFNPPWAAALLIPLALLPRLPGLIVLALVSTISLLLVARRMGMGLWGSVLLVTSLMHIESMLNGNIEFLPWLGVLFPAPVALIFFTIKPQATLGVIVLVLWAEWQDNGWVGLLKTLAPTAILTALWLLIWGLPPVRPAENASNFSLFPYSLFIGVPALAYALWRRDLRWAAFAGPLFSPYVIYHTYLALLFPLRGVWLLLAWLAAFIPILWLKPTA